ncbi:hypothetical protein CBS101457_005521 [Exobasidium rhododendri]|nr:hypothetical protein CBS101457_005521 [Exobasidium rhododendri]
MSDALATPLASASDRTAYLTEDFTRAGQTNAPSTESKADFALVESIAARIPRLRDPNDPLKLTPLRAHYLKKSLVKLQVDEEMRTLSRKDALSLLGPPFRPTISTQQASLPFLRFLFHHFILTFPFLRSAPPNFFSDKVQVFFERFLEKNISGTDDREETTKRRRLGGKASKWTVLLMSASIHLRGGSQAEEILRIADRDRGQIFAAQDRYNAHHPGQGKDQFDVNVIGVRSISGKKSRLGRAKAHDEFIIRTRRPGGRETFVSRRYGDFARLADTLRVEFPEEEIRRPPPKDRRGTDVKSTMHITEDFPEEMKRVAEEPPRIGHLHLDGEERFPASPASVDYHRSETNSSALPTARSVPQGPLARERNRLTLRAYLRSLLSNLHVADSFTLSSFLLSEPTTLSEAEERDALAREGLDAFRDDEAGRFTREANRRVNELKQHLQTFKADLIQRDGLSRVFGTIKATPHIEDLPESYRALIAWGRINTASTLFNLFVGGDTASELFGQLKRIHGLMPYFMLRSILRISNPISMIRSVMDVFLAQPFGQRSLLQRMLTSSIQEETKELGEIANGVAVKVEDDALCERVRCFVYAPQALQEEMRAEAEKDRLDLITVILKSSKLPPHAVGSPSPPPLQRTQVHRVVRSSRAYELYKDYRNNLGKNEMDEGPDAVDEQAWLYEDLHVLLKCLTRLRDKEQLISLIFEGVTSDLLRDIVTIFYSPLAQVYKAANIADSLSDLQAFINDLIKTVEANENKDFLDPQKTVQIFIDLVGRHESRFYHFVHQVHSKGSGLFDGLMHWIELFINFVRGPDDVNLPSTGQQRRGIGEIDLEICMPAGGEERRKAMMEIDHVVVHAYRLKLIRELKLKKKLADKDIEGAASKAGDLSGWGIDADDDSAFVSAMVENLGVGDAFTDEVEEVEAEEAAEDANEEGEGEDEEEEEGYGRADEVSEGDYTTDATSESDEGESTRQSFEEEVAKADVNARWRPPVPQRSFSTLTARPDDKELPAIPLAEAKRRRKKKMPKPPVLVVIPGMVPLFVEMVRPLLRPAKSASASSLVTPTSNAALSALLLEASGDSHSGPQSNSSSPSPLSHPQPPTPRAPGSWGW